MKIRKFVSRKPLHSSSSPAHALGLPTGNRVAASGKTAGSLAHEHALLPAIVQASDDAIHSKNLHGVITSWNAAAHRIFGYTADEIVGKQNTILFPPDRFEEEALILDHLRQGIPTNHFETVRLHKDGTPIDASVTISPIKDAQGQVIGAFTISRDISERKQAERQVALLSSVVAATLNGIVITDTQERVVYVNAAYERICGYTLKELLGRRVAEVLHGPGTDADTKRRIRAAINAEETAVAEILNYHKSGTPYWIETQIAPVRDTKGKVTHYVGIQNDITSRKEAERDLRRSEARYALAVEGSQNGIWDWDVRTGETHFSARWEQMIGYAEGEFPNHVEAWVSHLHPDDRPRVEATLAAYFSHETDVYTVEFRMRHKDGSYPWILARGVARFDSEGKPYRMAGSHMDITEQRRLTERLQTADQWQRDAIERLTVQQTELREANARLESLATTDGLTGIKNHRALQERLREEFDRARRYNTPLSILMLDVDQFKQYNDAFGHPAGDAVLRQVTEVCRQSARTCDIVARYGGDEFAVLLPGATMEEANTVAERFRHAIGTAVWPERAVTVSIGVATLAPAMPHPDSLLAGADAALYSSKHRGRNCVTHASDPVNVETLDIEAARWYDSVLQKLLEAQGETLVSAPEQLQENLSNAYDATIVSWSRILDLKDKETEGHSERVTEMLVRLTQYLNMNQQEVQFARWGALLHDIGKMAVPDGILHKPGPLTDDEWVIMRQHATIAYDMLQPIQFLGSAIDIPYCHHEKWDGSGYPRGLKADEIPLMARLFAVIDVYDALTSDRPYRKAWPEEKVRVHLREQSGTHFDPRAVEVFLNMLEEDCAMLEAA